VPVGVGVSVAPDEQHDRQLLLGERLHRGVDAEELLRIADADTCFPAATRTLLD
jgi:hypothetical protein